MKYIFFLLSTLLLFSCKTTYNNYSSYDEVYDTYTPIEEVVSSDQVEQTNTNTYFIGYDLWTYRYPYYRRSWFYNNYNYNWNYWSIYSPNYYNWYLYQPNYWNLGNNWYYHCGPYYTNYWNNNWYGNYWYSNYWYSNYWYSNHYHPYYFSNNNRPIIYGHRNLKSPTMIQRPNLSTRDKVPVKKPNPAPVEKPKKDPYIYSNPNTQPVRVESKPNKQPIRVESKPSKVQDTRKPVRTQPNPPVRTQPRTNQPQRVQPSQNKQPNIQRSVNPQPQKNNKPKR